MAQETKSGTKKMLSDILIGLICGLIVGGFISLYNDMRSLDFGLICLIYIVPAIYQNRQDSTGKDSG